ncbi:hypothetical protein O5853_26475 [Escherichia coli]|nr:hypothetical protein [Escherichia coli]
MILLFHVHRSPKDAVPTLPDRQAPVESVWIPSALPFRGYFFSTLRQMSSTFLSGNCCLAF